MDVEEPTVEWLRHGFAAPEIHHVERAAGADVGQRLAYRRAEPIFACAENAAAQQIGDLGRGEVDQRCEVAVVGELFQALASSTGGSRF